MDYGTELIKGNTHTLVLTVLMDGPQHGYGIAREIEKRSNNMLNFKEGTLYPVLHALERDTMIVGAWHVSDSGPPRKMYTITDAGCTELDRRTRLWREFSRIIDVIIDGGKSAQTN